MFNKDSRSFLACSLLIVLNFGLSGVHGSPLQTNEHAATAVLEARALDVSRFAGQTIDGNSFADPVECYVLPNALTKIKYLQKWPRAKLVSAWNGFNKAQLTCDESKKVCRADDIVIDPAAFPVTIVTKFVDSGAPGRVIRAHSALAVSSRSYPKVNRVLSLNLCGPIH